MNNHVFNSGDRVRITSPTFPDAEGTIIALHRDSGYYAVALNVAAEAKIRGEHLERINPMDDSTEPPPHEPTGSHNQKVLAWERVADHPAFASCYDKPGTLLAAVLERLDDLLSLEGATTQPAPDLPVIESWSEVPDGAVIEIRQRWTVQAGRVYSAVGEPVRHLVEAPEPDPDAALVAALAARMEAECACMSMDDHVMRDLIALVRQAGEQS